MFAKTVVFFFALAAFANGAPVKDYSAYPGVRPLHPITVTLPNVGHVLQPIVSKRDLPLDLQNDIGPDLNLDLNLDADFERTLPLNERGLLGSETADSLRVLIGDTVNKRAAVNPNASGPRALGGTGLDGLYANTDVVSTRIQQLKNLPGRSVNKPVQARDIVVNAQLQNFVSSTVNLLRTLGKSGAVDTFLSKVNDLKAEARNGTLDAGDLLNAARDILSSVL